MAVYTDLPHADAAALLEHLGLGPLQSLRGIQAGIENSNWFATTPHGEFVVTIFERLTAAQLPFYLRLMQHLAGHGLPVPAPHENADGQIVHTLCGKPAAVVDKLSGTPQLSPSPHHAAQLGEVLARMHLAGRDFPLSQPHLRGLAWWDETVPVLAPRVPAPQRELLASELAFQQRVAASADHALLPRGPVHADLFRDNAMFEGPSGHERLSGIFDFYFAGIETWLFDLAVCLNDWAIDLPTGRLDLPRAQALVAAYEAVRPLSGAEHRLLPAMLRAAALRFWISRLWDWHLPRPATLLQPHDPTHFERVLRERIDHAWHALPTA